MKKIISFLVVAFFAISLQAQTSADLIGKWKLVSFKTVSGEDRNIKELFKTDEVYQVFKAGGEFESIVGEKVTEGKWEMIDGNKKLKIEAGIAKVTYDIVSFEGDKRVVSSKLGVNEYVRVPD